MSGVLGDVSKCLVWAKQLFVNQVIFNLQGYKTKKAGNLYILEAENSNFLGIFIVIVLMWQVKVSDHSPPCSQVHH